MVVKDQMKWRPVVSFDKCYLSVYPGKEGKVYFTREMYWLMGKPKKVNVTVIGDKIVLSAGVKYGYDIVFRRGKQPYIVSQEVSKVIGPGNRAYYSYDEEDYGFYDNKWKKYRKRRYFYFRVNRRVIPDPSRKPNPPATM